MADSIQDEYIRKTPNLRRCSQDFSRFSLPVEPGMTLRWVDHSP